jgi:hypothetical protein
MDRRSAVDRLDAALAEQARLGEQYDRARGTSTELSTFSRLQTAGLRVALCQRGVDATDSPTVEASAEEPEP